MTKRLFSLATAFTGLFLLGACFAPNTRAVWAAGPLDGVVSGVRNLGKRVESDPNKEYRLVRENGPWMILVTSFSGPTAEEDAKALVLELRSRHKMKAYVFDKTFVPEMSDQEKRSLSNKRLIYQNNEASRQFAVLIGDFPMMDDMELGRTLEQIRGIYPECMKGTGRLTATQKLTSVVAKQSTESNLRPFGNAFPTTNPMLPRGFFSKKGVVDPFIEKINSVSEYSLLNNPAKFTVQIATFTGYVEQVKIYESFEKSESTTNAKTAGQSELEKGGKAAVILCALLRAKGYDAYEFHDRHASIVTIGAYDYVGTPQANGTIEFIPEIANIFRLCTAKKVDPRNYANSTVNTIGYEPVKIDGIALDLQPKVILVPKKTAAAASVRR